MRNFRMTVKMMVMALVMAAAFCSCNAAGGTDFYEAQSSRVSNAEIIGDGPVTKNPVGFSIIIPEINVSVEGADQAKMSADGTTAITATATEGATFMWYVNGRCQNGQTGPAYELSCAYPGVYEVTCIAVSADGTLAKSASKRVTVLP